VNPASLIFTGQKTYDWTTTVWDVGTLEWPSSERWMGVPSHGSEGQKLSTRQRLEHGDEEMINKRQFRVDRIMRRRPGLNISAAAINPQGNCTSVRSTFSARFGYRAAMNNSLEYAAQNRRFGQISDAKSWLLMARTFRKQLFLVSVGREP
jgi:hypothetical protein